MNGDDYSTAAERLDRKTRSEAILKAVDVPINARLPGIETAGEVSTHSMLVIARRAVCLLLVAATCEIDKPSLEGLVEEHGAIGQFTSAEQAHLDSDPWNAEAAWVLLWALGYTRPLGLPSAQIRPWDAIEIVDGHDPDWLATNSKPKSVSEVLDEADLIYRCHWAVREAELRGSSAPDALDPSVTIERHHALNWLIDSSADWDLVDTST